MGNSFFGLVRRGGILPRGLCIFLFCVISLIYGSVGVIYAQSLELSVMEEEVDVYGVVQVSLDIQAGSASDISEVSIAGIEQFDLLQQSRRQATQIINGVRSASVTLNLQLGPQAEGTYTLGPASGVMDGEVVTSDVVEVRVGAVEGVSAGALSAPLDTSAQPFSVRRGGVFGDVSRRLVMWYVLLGVVIGFLVWRISIDYRQDIV